MKKVKSLITIECLHKYALEHKWEKVIEVKGKELLTLPYNNIKATYRINHNITFLCPSGILVIAHLDKNLKITNIENSTSSQEYLIM